MKRYHGLTKPQFDALRVVIELGCARESNVTSLAGRCIYWQARRSLEEKALITGSDSELMPTLAGRQLYGRVMADGEQLTLV